MGISYNATTATITVTGGSYTEPFSMADIIAHGTAGGHVATGGYGGREATVSANLVIGSTTGSTFYDPTGYITKEASGYELTVYHHSLRCAKMSDTWASRTFGDAIPATSEHDRKLRSVVLMMYVDETGFVCPVNGKLKRAMDPTPLGQHTGEPIALQGNGDAGEWDPCGLFPIPEIPRLEHGLLPDDTVRVADEQPEPYFPPGYQPTEPIPAEPIVQSYRIRPTVVLVRSNHLVCPG